MGSCAVKGSRTKKISKITLDLARPTYRSLENDEFDRALSRKLIFDKKDKHAPKLDLEKNQLYMKRIKI
jgi:hypothetical protein